MYKLRREKGRFALLNNDPSFTSCPPRICTPVIYAISSLQREQPLSDSSECLCVLTRPTETERKRWIIRAHATARTKRASLFLCVVANAICSFQYQLAKRDPKGIRSRSGALTPPPLRSYPVPSPGISPSAFREIPLRDSTRRGSRSRFADTADASIRGGRGRGLRIRSGSRHRASIIENRSRPLRAKRLSIRLIDR